MTRLSILIPALLASAIIVVLGLQSFHTETGTTRPVVLPFEVFWCEKDDDCSVVERIGCCPCSAGGAQAAVTEWRRDELRRFLKKACRRTQVCVQVDLCDTSLVPRCIDRHCRLVRPPVP